MSTDFENFVAATNHERPGRILYSANFVDDLANRVREHIGSDDIGAHYGFFEPVGVGLRPPEGYQPIDYSPYWEGEDLPEGTAIDGNGVAMVPSGFYHFWGYVSPLRNATSLSDIENYPLDDMTLWDDSKMAAEVSDAHAAGKVSTLFVGHMYESAWQIRGYEQFLMDTVERPEWAECLLERIFQQNMVRAEAAGKAGVMYVKCGDDVANQNAMMFNKPTWAKLIHGRWAQIWQRVHELNPDAKIWYHTDGNCIDIVDDMVESGLNVLNPIQPECLDIDDVHRRYKGRLSFDGGMGTQSTMPWGSPDDVRARVKELIDNYGRDGGLLISPTHVLEPEVPLANIDAFAEACREYGTFE
ncbi:MAG: uroporphyrinogen decarboxylase family protein [Planctomycetota bacterium]|jgi:uroporphyrinogen decarboxylase